LNRNSVPNYTFIKQQLTTRTSFYFLSIVFFLSSLTWRQFGRNCRRCSGSSRKSSTRITCGFVICALVTL